MYGIKSYQFNQCIKIENCCHSYVVCNIGDNGSVFFLFELLLSLSSQLYFDENTCRYHLKTILIYFKAYALLKRFDNKQTIQLRNTFQKSRNLDIVDIYSFDSLPKLLTVLSRHTNPYLIINLKKCCCLSHESCELVTVLWFECPYITFLYLW